MMKLDRLAHFHAVAGTGSFTAAAAQLGVTKAVVSAQVARLEEELGASLFLRTTRSVTLTEDGALLLDHAERILSEAAEAEEALQSRRGVPTGHLRITAPLDYGQSFLVPVLAEFRARHPACTVELDLSDSRFDLQSGDWDLAIRLGWLRDSSLKSRRVGGLKQALVACPALAAAQGTPRSPADLAPWPFVGNLALPDPARAEFSGPDGARARVRLSIVAGMTTTPAALAGALAGLGAAILPDFLVAAPLAAGRLVRLLPDWTLPEGGIFIVYPPARFRPPRVAAFTDLLVEAERRRQAAG
ncbi:LysR substrate-binding domain-containing protein [Rhodovulum sp. DZ06]|uniref:LysR family transcriptional regulator n=1 Tax=Rhodovulum sp. DZ06 TaxID=3425126 RepID=UPI003D3307DE